MLNSLERLSAGAVSTLLVDDKNAYLVQVAGKKLPVIDSHSPEYIQLGAGLSANTANISRSEALAALVQAELARSAPPEPGAE